MRSIIEWLIGLVGVRIARLLVVLAILAVATVAVQLGLFGGELLDALTVLLAP